MAIVGTIIKIIKAIIDI
ncbi:phenol-soluble modulin PSM-alpha-4, partial [Staphylococcus aureus]|nr:phenol-soluble modulin PSM-alpha-4 [Staphylococcus aureus]